MQVDLLRASLGGKLDHGCDVILVAVHSARAHESHDMDGLACLDSLVNGAAENLILEEVTVLDGLGNAGELLIDDAACADIGMADLGISHLALGKADIAA